MQKDGVVELDGWQIRVTDDARALLRSVCAVFDRALGQGGARHAGAV
jgi:coproporphyrinogen III oxidase-like Fe-S oxidoreductase